MNILIINNEFPPIGGGGSILTSYIAKNLVLEGHNVIVLTSSFSNLPYEERIDGYTVIRTKSLRSSTNSASYIELVSFALSSFITGLKICSTFKPDLIQAHFAVPAGGTAMALSYMTDIPYAVYLGGSDAPNANPGRHKSIYPFIIPFIKKILSHASLVTACSDMLIQNIHSYQPNLKVHKIPNGVDTKDFTYPVKKDSIPPIRILSVGRIIPRKGFQFLIGALARIDKKNLDMFRVTIIGSGEYREELKKMAFAGGVDHLIQFVDSVPYNDLKTYYQNAHVFCLPSLAEGMPLAMLEAMACGCALITSDVAGNQELVQNGKNGYLVRPGSEDDVFEVLQKLLIQPDDIIKMGIESTKKAKKYDWKTLTSTYIDLYKKIINTHHENSHNWGIWVRGGVSK